MGFRRVIPWRFQPQIPVGINWANPITRDLSIAMLNGRDVVNNVPYPLVRVGVSSQGVTETGGNGAYVANADTADCTLIGHHKYTSNDSDFSGQFWGNFDGTGATTSQLGIGLDSNGQIYAANRSGANPITDIEAVTFPYEAVWAIRQTMGSGASAQIWKNGVLFTSVPQQGSLAFTTNTLRTLERGKVTSVGKGYAWCFKFNRILRSVEIASLSENPWQVFTPLTRTVAFVTGTISRPGTDVSVAGWTFNGASLSASIGETTRNDATYAQAAYGVAGAVTTLTQSLPAGSYIVTFAGEYLTAAASSGQFRFTAMDGSNTVLGVSSWQAVTSAFAQYTVPLTVTGGTAVRLMIEIQA